METNDHESLLLLFADSVFLYVPGLDSESPFTQRLRGTGVSQRFHKDIRVYSWIKAES